MSILQNTTALQNEQSELQSLLKSVNALPEAGGGPYETCSITINGVTNGWVAYMKLRDGEPLVWLSTVYTWGQTIANVVKGTDIHVYAGGATVLYSASSGLTDLYQLGIFPEVMSQGRAYRVAETAGDTETITITLD